MHICAVLVQNLRRPVEEGYANGVGGGVRSSVRMVRGLPIHGSVVVAEPCDVVLLRSGHSVRLLTACAVGISGMAVSSPFWFAQ